MYDFTCFAATLPDPASIQAVVSALSDADLAALEDDLDFFRFAHVPSVRMLAILDQLGALDPEWREMLETAADLDLPAAA